MKKEELKMEETMMKETTYEEILSELEKFDVKDRYDDSNIASENKKIKEIETKLIKSEEVSILGYDIYKYSQFDESQQNLIPFVFELLKKETIRFCIEGETALFSKSDFSDNFISTGDGGFLIFRNPLKAIVFNTIFFAHLQTFNSYRFYPKLRHYIGPLTIRSCLTRDNVFHYQKNYYGPGIITNARILSKDKLNRFLIDEETHLWFLSKFTGIENITEITLEDISQVIELNKKNGISIFFTIEERMEENKRNRKHCKFKSCHLQKVGSVKAKESTISVYNVELQSYMYIFDEKDEHKGKHFIVSIGNSNCTGIGEI